MSFPVFYSPLKGGLLSFPGRILTLLFPRPIGVVWTAKKARQLQMAVELLSDPHVDTSHL